MTVPAAPPAGRGGNLWPAAALVLNSLVWGCSWWPFRALAERGLHPLWATVVVYALAVTVIGTLRPRAFAQVARSPALWVLVFAAGTTNAAFNWGVTIGDVVRVILLFYLMPLWAVLLARLLLNEPLTRLGALRIALALAGAAIVLAPPAQAAGAPWWAALPLPRSLADWLGVLGGLSFALNNVMLRREATQPEEGRAMAMFGGGMLVSAVLATLLASNAQVPWPPAPAVGWLAGAAGLSALFLGSNLALQYGASRLPANTTSVIMLSEVVFASASAAVWGGAQIGTPLLAGGALILAAALLATLERAQAP